MAQEAPLCLLIQTSYQNLIPEPHTTTCQRISRDRQRAFYTEGLRRRTRTCYEHPRRTFLQAQMQSIFKVLMQGHLEEDLNRISTRPLLTMIMDPKDFSPEPFQDLLTRTCIQDHARTSDSISLGPVYKIMRSKDLFQDPYTIYSQGIVKDFDQDLHARTPKRISQGREKRTC